MLSSCRAANTDFRNSLSPYVYHPSLLAGLPGYILYPYRAAVDRFHLVILHLHVHVKGSTGECRL